MGLSKGLHAHRGALPLRSATSSIQPWEKLTHQRIRQSCNPLRKRIRSVAARSEVDAYFAETDSSFFEDVSQIYFIANTGLLPLNKTETDSFVKRYVNELNIENRIRLIREMHLQMLKEMTVIPLVIKPYFAVTNKNWQMTLPTLQAGTPIWGITKSN